VNIHKIYVLPVIYAVVISSLRPIVLTHNKLYVLRLRAWDRPGILLESRWWSLKGRNSAVRHRQYRYRFCAWYNLRQLIN